MIPGEVVPVTLESFAETTRGLIPLDFPRFSDETRLENFAGEIFTRDANGERGAAP